METTRIQVYKTSTKRDQKIVIFAGIILSIFCLLAILIILISGNPKFLKFEMPAYILVLIQSISWPVFTIIVSKKEKYFVSWDDNEIQYLIPKNKEIETIKINDIHSIEKTNLEFKISLKNNEIKNFSFYYFFFPKRKEILDFFESLKSQVENGSSSKLLAWTTNE